MAVFEDITEKRFVRLIAVKRVGKQHGSPLWECKCDCGNIINVSIQKLNNGDTKSCGCLREEYYKEDAIKFIKNYQVEGTNVAYLKSERLSKSNKSGVRGVSKKKNGKWLAQIVFQRNAYNLGTYEKFEDAVKARKEAEEKFFKPILDSYKGADADETK